MPMASAISLKRWAGGAALIACCTAGGVTAPASGTLRRASGNGRYGVTPGASTIVLFDLASTASIVS